MKINIKNHSSLDSQKLGTMKNFLKFCQEKNPLKSDVNFVFVDTSVEDFFDGKYLIPTKNISVDDCLINIAKKWMKELQSQRNIKTSDREVDALLFYFKK